MPRYDEYDMGSSRGQRDLVLSVNEFCFLQNKTDGTIKSYVGPLTTTISQQEALVIFNTKNKKFEEISDFEKAKQLFVSAPEGWYAVLKNPTTDNQYPEAGKVNTSPKSIVIGHKINIPGPISFALYPGQMAKVVRGHRLRSNQYLLARVYDAEAAMKNISSATIVDADGKEVTKKPKTYFMGQLLVIKGTEVSFYVPPTGIEVIPVTGKGESYVRDAVTLERLEYAILKDEDGEKRYVHGPAVVFPKPTETFVKAPKGGNIFRALELSPISGIYVKVIAAYKDDNGTEHPIGEELFITGNDQMIYYPRPEHALIQYDGKYMHHAIAIPKGEGRYILNRLTGEIKTVEGPKMYLPDPRHEVVVKRKLTPTECELFYPGNKEVLKYNLELTEKATELAARKGLTNNIADVLNCCYSTDNQEGALAIFEANANISRGVSYTKPRTITLDTKYEGVVAINVWTGYAINVVSKDGSREVVVGPTTRLLNYDETLEPITLSTGCPKSTKHACSTAYLRVENNKVSDKIIVQTKDFVDAEITVSYCVNFLEKYKDKWFSNENYIKSLTDRMRSMLKKEIKQYSSQDFYANSTEIIRNIVLGKNETTKDKKKTNNYRLFEENGMAIFDVDILNVRLQADIQNLMEEHQYEIISKNLELSDATSRIAVETELNRIEKEQAKMNNETQKYKLSLTQSLEEERIAKEEAIKEKKRAAELAEQQARNDLQAVLGAIQEAELSRRKAAYDLDNEKKIKEAEIEKAKQKAYAETVKSIMGSISPDLAAALTSKSNEDMLATVTKAMSPYAIARGESVSEVTNNLLRGTSLEKVIDGVNLNV